MNEKIVISNLPFPPTVNHRYMPAGGRLILSKKTRNYKDEILLHLFSEYKNINVNHLIKKVLEVKIYYIANRSFWFTKKNEIKNIDVDNRHKSILDGVFPFLSLKDSQPFKIEIHKIIDSSYSVPKVNLIIQEYSMEAE